MSILKNNLTAAKLIADFPAFFDAFSDSLRAGEASRRLEHDDVVVTALTLGKVHTLHKIANKAGSDLNIAPIILQLHAEYARIHGAPYNG